MRNTVLASKSLLLLILMLLSQGACWGQWDSDYQPLPSKSPALDSVLGELKAAQEQRMTKIDPKKQKLLYEAMTERYASVKYKIENDHLLYDAAIDRYLKGILTEIFENNPSLPRQDIRLLLARYPWPNANALGEGTILLNIGLVPHLDNESQLAFVLCHEIAHCLLNHVDNAIMKRISILESKATKQEMAAIAKTEYGARAKAMALLKEISYDAHRHSRLHEAQADSLALELLMRTHYDATEALKCLGILDNIDEMDSSQIDLKALLDSKELPFDPAWLRIEHSGFGHSASENELNEDSLKTHPDCAHRIRLLVPRLEDYNSRGKTVNLQGAAAFSQFASTCTFEGGRSYYFFDDVGKSLFQTIILLQEHPKNAYLMGWVGICMNRIFTSQKNHEQGKYVSMPDEELPAQYNLLLNFIHNIRLSDLGRINHSFLQRHLGESLDRRSQSENEYLLFAWWGSCKNVGDLDACAKAKATYLERFPKGEFLNQLKIE